MIRLTKVADYGVVLLAYMASVPGGRTFNVRDLAKTAQLSPSMVSKVLKALTRGGVLESQMGSKGGYRLSRNANEINIAEVIAALDGPIRMTECADVVDSNCAIELLCPVRVGWQKVNAAVRKALEGITLADLMQGGSGEERATKSPEPASFTETGWSRETGVKATIPRTLDIGMSR